jgi:hypothetical protein
MTQEVNIRMQVELKKNIKNSFDDMLSDVLKGKKSIQDFSKNIDGAFCITFINKCAHTITIPYDYKVYRNMLNINMSYKDIVYFLTYAKS